MWWSFGKGQVVGILPPKGAGGLSPGFQPWDYMKAVRPEGARGYWKRASNRDHLKPIYFYYGVVSTFGLARSRLGMETVC